MTVTYSSELEGGTLGLLLTTEFEVLATLQRQLHLVLAHCAFKSQHDLFRSLGLLMEDRLRLTTIT